MYTIGTHMSIAGGLAKTAENVVKMNADTMQIFSRNPRGSSYKTYLPEEIERFQKIRKDHAFGPVLAHAPYTMNLASAKPEVYEFACTVIREDMTYFCFRLYFLPLFLSIILLSLVQLCYNLENTPKEMF